MEFRKRCNVCGTIFCYTDEDLKKNTKNAGMAALSALGGLASTLGGGTIFHTHHLQGQADRHLDQVVDYDQCPNCHSRDLSFLDEGTSHAQQIPAQAAPVNINTSASTEALLKRVFLFLEDGNWASANAYCESCLDRDPELAEAYLGKLMVELRVKNREQLATLAEPIDSNGNYQKAMRFGDEVFRQTLSGYNKKILEHKEFERQQKEMKRQKDIYTRANNLMQSAKTEKAFLDAAQIFETVSDFQDAALLAQDCLEKSKLARKDEILEQAKSKMKGSFISEYEYAIRILRPIRGWKNADQLIAECEDTIRRIQEEKERQKRELEEQIKRSKKKRMLLLLLAGAAVLLIVFAVILFTVIPQGNRYNEAVALMEQGKYAEAITAFREVKDYQDSEQKIDECTFYIASEQYKEAEALKEKDPLAAARAFLAIESLPEARTQAFAIWEQLAYRETISGGWGHTVALRTDGTVVAAGENEDGRCNVSDWNNVIAVSAGGYHTVGLQENGTVVATGYNGKHQCNVSDWKDIVAISAGKRHTVGLKADGTVVATDEKEYGQQEISKWTDIIAVSAGSYHTVGLKIDGTVVATVYADDYDCGQCDVSGWSDIIAVSAGADHTVGLKADGTVVAVGNNNSGQCNVSGWNDIVAVAAGDTHTVGLKADGTVVAAGFNEDSRCVVSGLRDVSAIAAGGIYTVAVKYDGTVAVAGNAYNYSYDVAKWTQIKVPAPTFVPEQEQVPEGQLKLTWEEAGARRTIAAGHDHTVAVKKNGTAVATAIKFNKEYDFDSVQDYGQSKVGDWKDLVAVAAGDQHTVGLRSDGTVVATGINWYKECEVDTWRDVVAVAAGYEVTLGLKSDGTVLATGYNAFGQCNVGKWQDIVAVAAGFEHTVGLKSDGTVVTAGWNQYGQCDVSDWTDIVAIAADDSITVGLKSDGTVVAAGDLSFGRDRISHWGNIVAIDADSSHIVGLKSDGTVVAAGYSEDSRCHVGKWKDIVAVAAGSFHTVGLKSDGTVVSTKPVSEVDFGQSNVGKWKNINKP